MIDKATDGGTIKDYVSLLEKKAVEQFLTALHFEGLDLKVYRKLKREVHNG